MNRGPVPCRRSLGSPCGAMGSPVQAPPFPEWAPILIVYFSFMLCAPSFTNGAKITTTCTTFYCWGINFAITHISYTPLIVEN